MDIQWSARWNAEYGVRIALAREVTELRRAERELEHRATHDPLNGTAEALLAHADRAMYASKRQRTSSGQAAATI